MGISKIVRLSVFERIIFKKLFEESLHFYSKRCMCVKNQPCFADILFVVPSPSGTRDSSWIKMNAGQTGFYRVNYGDENWRKLKEQLDTNHQVISSMR